MLTIVQNLRPQPPNMMDNFITHVTDCMLRPCEIAHIFVDKKDEAQAPVYEDIQGHKESLEA